MLITTFFNILIQINWYSQAEKKRDHPMQLQIIPETKENSHSTVNYAIKISLGCHLHSEAVPDFEIFNMNT